MARSLCLGLVGWREGQGGGHLDVRRRRKEADGPQRRAAREEARTAKANAELTKAEVRAKVLPAQRQSQRRRTASTRSEGGELLPRRRRWRSEPSPSPRSLPRCRCCSARRRRRGPPTRRRRRNLRTGADLAATTPRAGDAAGGRRARPTAPTRTRPAARRGRRRGECTIAAHGVRPLRLHARAAALLVRLDPRPQRPSRASTTRCACKLDARRRARRARPARWAQRRPSNGSSPTSRSCSRRCCHATRGCSSSIRSSTTRRRRPSCSWAARGLRHRAPTRAKMRAMMGGRPIVRRSRPPGRSTRRRTRDRVDGHVAVARRRRAQPRDGARGERDARADAPLEYVQVLQYGVGQYYRGPPRLHPGARAAAADGACGFTARAVAEGRCSCTSPTSTRAARPPSSG